MHICIYLYMQSERQTNSQQFRSRRQLHNTAKIIMTTLARDLWNNQDVEVEITRFHHLMDGYGHKKVFFEIEFRGSKKTFTTISTDMEFFDNLDDDNYSEWDQLYFDKFFNDVTESVDEWVSDIMEEENEIEN